MDNPKIAYVATTISVLFCIALAAYNTDGNVGRTVVLTLIYMLGLFLFLGLCLMLKLALQALFSRHA